MKQLILIHLFFITALTVFSQQKNLTVKTPAQSISVSLDDDNTEKSVVINLNKKTLAQDKLVVHNSNTQELKDWNRSYIIFNEASAEVAKLKTSGKTAEIAIAYLKKKLQQNKDYGLYTVALPKDPAKAALVRVRRILICTLRVK